MGYLRVLIRVAASIVACFLLIAENAISQDEVLDPGFEEFLHARHKIAPYNQDAAIGVMGLLAPPGVDVFDHGRFVAALNRENLSVDETRKRRAATGEVAFVLDRAELDCWVSPKFVVVTGNSACASQERLTNLLLENGTLLSRYRQLFSLPHFSTFTSDGGLLLYLNWLVFAEIELDQKRGRTERAYLNWRANHRFLLKAIAGEGAWVEKAILSAALGGSLSTAESLLHAAPELLKDHHAELIDMFTLKGIAEWNMEGTIRSELVLREAVFQPDRRLSMLHPNFVRNRLLHFSRDLLSAFSEFHGNTLLRKLRDVKEAHGRKNALADERARYPIGTLILRDFFVPQLMPTEMVGSMLHQIGRMRLLVLRVAIERDKIPMNAVPEFLKATQTHLRDPFSGEPMRWSSEHRVIWFESTATAHDSISSQVRLAGGSWYSR